MESIGRLAGGVAHDFNNMLSEILGHVELLLNPKNSCDPCNVKSLQEIQNAASRSADLTRQLLTFARKQSAIPKVIDLNESVENTLKLLRRLIGESIDLTWIPGANFAKVKIDPGQLDKILLNLTINSRDAITEWKTNYRN